VAAVESWFAERGVRDVHAGGEAPFYLWPGVDVRQTAALCLFEAVGYAERGAVCNLSCPSSFRSPPPSGVELRRVLTEEDADGVVAMVDAMWPWWRAETMRAIDQGSCLAAREGNGEVLGFGCHSVNRGGWIGPIGTATHAQGRSIGRAVLGALCADLGTAGYRRAEISWVGPVGFYARAADAHVSRVFQSRGRRLG
ncbi:MAG: GNAT family N-acetyltransferase, partial [Acidimicrobiales bacterium]